MPSIESVLVACQLTRSAFSGERVFRIAIDGGLEYTGIAPVQHCYHRNAIPLQPNEPAEDASTEGCIEGHLVGGLGDQVQVELPDGGAVQLVFTQENIPYKWVRISRYEGITS